MKKILFVYNTKTTFTRQDFEILKLKFDVEEVFVSSFWVGLTFVLKNKLSKYHFAYFWFTSLSYLPLFSVAKLIHLPTVIVAGGYDVANIPEIKYGSGTQSWLHKTLRKFFLKSAKVIISISVSNQKDLMRTVPQAAGKNSLIYFGFTDPKKEIVPLEQRSKRIITVGAVNSITFERKGLRFFAELSKLMPDWDFLIIGKYDAQTKAKLTAIGGTNLRFSGFLSDEDFYREIAGSKFSVQLSYHEAFGISVVDAALLGVYPIVFDRFALSEVVAQDGAIVPFGDIDAVKQTILKMNNSGYDPVAMKSSYLKRFPLSIKTENLLEITSSIVK